MKIIKLIYNVLSALILTVCVSLAILLVGVKLFGFTPYAVLSGSMEPEYPVGSAVYVRSVEAENIEVGDVITFYMSNSSTVVTHQVIEIDGETGLYYTKGLSNDTADGSPVSIDNIIGKVSFCIPYMGYISVYITSPPWIYLIIAAVLIWIIIIYMIDVLKEEEGERDEFLIQDEMSESHRRRMERREKNAKRKVRRKAAAQRRRQSRRF